MDEEGVLFFLYVLEGVFGENEIGVRVENLLDIVVDKDGLGGGFLLEKVVKL